MQNEQATSAQDATAWKEVVEERIAASEAQGARVVSAERAAADAREEADALRLRLAETEARRAEASAAAASGSGELAEAERERARSERERSLALQRELDAANAARQFAEERALKAELLGGGALAVAEQVPGLEEAALNAIEQQLSSLEGMLERGEQRLADIEGGASSSEAHSQQGPAGSPGMAASWGSMAHNPVFAR